MARRSTGKPWLHEKSSYWCTSVDRKRVYLDKDYKVASRKLRQLKADLKRSEQGASNEWLNAPIADLADEFLDDEAIRNHVEGKFGQAKRRFGLGRIMAKLASTSAAQISLSFLVMNLEESLRRFFLSLFLLCHAWGRTAFT